MSSWASEPATPPGPPPAAVPPAPTAPAAAAPANPAEGSEVTAPPTQQAPTEVPALPASPPPPPAQDQAGAPPVAAAGPPPVAVAPPPASGQWVYTSQYNWVWVPYARNYTYVDPAGELAFTYAYYPAYGWRWLPSPWVLGWGPRPYWGGGGTAYFAWYAHPWFTRGVYRTAVWERYGRSYYGRPMAPRAVYAHPNGGFGGYRGGGGHHR